MITINVKIYKCITYRSQPFLYKEYIYTIIFIYLYVYVASWHNNRVSQWFGVRAARGCYDLGFNRLQQPRRLQFVRGDLHITSDYERYKQGMRLATCEVRRLGVAVEATASNLIGCWIRHIGLDLRYGRQISPRPNERRELGYGR